MSADYSNEVSMAQEMIAAKGQTLTLTRKTVTQDPLTDAKTTVTATGTFDCVALDFSTYDKTNRTELIGNSSKKLLCPSASFTMLPKDNDLVTYEGENWTVKGISELNPAGTSIIFTLAIVK